MQVEKKEPYHIQAYNLIKARILSGEIACGDRINEVTLAQELGISRSPIREAVRMLESDQLVITVGSTHYINPMDEKMIKDVYACRMCLESYAARLAADSFTEEDYAQLMSFIQQTRETADTGDRHAQIYLNTYYHDYIISKCGNAFLIDLLGRIRDVVILSRVKELDSSDGIDYAESDHIKIADALLAHDADETERLMKAHLQNNLESFKMQ